MGSSDRKTKLTLTVDPSIKEDARKVAEERGISLSRLVENYLVFVAKRKVYCFKCGKEFSAVRSEMCPKCGWMRCAECKACRCSMSEDAAQVAYYMRKVYEDLLGGRIR